MAKKILLADDSITIQKVIELTFSDEDFDVVTVGNGRLALERLPEVRPDIVLCDIIMPERDGYEVCEQIKSNPAWSHVPVLLLTGAFEPFDQERAARAGYDGSLAKPFEPETLIAKVKELLARAPRPAAPAVAPTTPPASVLPFARPSAAAPAATGSFIPDEPFAALDDSAFTPEPEPLAPEAVPAPAPALASMSEAESTSLAAAAPARANEDDDGTSTVVFRAGTPRWDAPPATPPAEAVRRGLIQEPTLVPLTSAPPLETEIEPEPEAFEAVLEEDLDFGTPGDEFAPDATGPDSDAAPVEEPIFTPEVRRTDAHGVGSTGAFAALVRDEPAKDPAADTASFIESPLNELPPGALPPGGPTGAHEELEKLAMRPHPEPEPAAQSESDTIATTAASRAAEPAAATAWEGEEISFPEPEPETIEGLEEVPLAEPEDAAGGVAEPRTDWPEPEPVPLEEAEPLAVEDAETTAPEPIEESFGEPASTLVPASAPRFVAAEPHAAPSAVSEIPVVMTIPPRPVAATPPAEVDLSPELPEEAGIESAPPVLNAPPPTPVAATAPQTPAAPPIPEEEDFADLTPEPALRVGDVAPAPAAAHSLAAEVAVPVEMVERIAQRVIAQISDKVIREIAWEVIPDLAETIIKKEIERLKAELAKL